MAMGGQPFQTAQAQSADSGFGYQPAAPSADMSMQQPGAPGSMQPGGPAPQPSFYSGSMSEFGQMRDAIMAQFPGINNLDEEDAPMDFSQKMGLMAIALANPEGALDMIKQKKDRALRKRQQAAEMAMNAGNLAARVLDSQNSLQLGIANMNAQAAHWKAQEDAAVVSGETERMRARFEETRANIAMSEAKRGQTAQDIALSMMGTGTDRAGNEMSFEPGTPGMTSRATAAGLQPEFGPTGVTLGPAKAGAQPNSVAFRQAAMAEQAARLRTGRPFVSPDFQGMGEGDLMNVIAPTTSIGELSRRRNLTGNTNTPAPPANRPAPSMLRGGMSTEYGLPEDEEPGVNPWTGPIG